MTDTEMNSSGEDLREETAADAPEVAEHDRVAELENQLAEAKQQTLYAQAEIQNVRRRAEKDTGEDKFKGLVTGLEATGRELTNVFQRHGLTKIEAMGQPLDPNRHQAMLEVPSDAEAGTIVQEMQSGWMIKDRLLRPALVGVAKKPD